MTVERIAVIGAGNWGTTLADLLAKKGNQVTLWAYEPEVREAIERTQENPLYLPGVRLSPALRATGELAEALEGAQAVISVVPSHVVRQVMGQAAPFFPPGVPLLSASKGLETDRLLRVSQVLEEVLPPGVGERLAILAGPSFAREVAAELPAAVTVASANPETAQFFQELLSTHYFRVYTHDDVIGAELGGALKNVMAIAAGISDGLGLGHNTRAALITRGLVEMTEIGRCLGAQPQTFVGLSGLGDLVLTCTGALSRNRAVGVQLGQGRRLEEILAEMRMVAEGIRTSQAAMRLAEAHGVEMPITAEVSRILFEGKPPHQALHDLMTRPRGREFEEEA